MTQQHSTLSVDISACYHPEQDQPNTWRVTPSGDHVHIDIVEQQYVGPPFNRVFERTALSVLVLRYQAEALLAELQAKLSKVEMEAVA